MKKTGHRMLRIAKGWVGSLLAPAEDPRETFPNSYQPERALPREPRRPERNIDSSKPSGKSPAGESREREGPRPGDQSPVVAGPWRDQPRRDRNPERTTAGPMRTQAESELKMWPAPAMALLRVFLLPVDLMLQLVGPRYGLYMWFFRVAPPWLTAGLGRLRAVRALDHAVRKVPAYEQFLAVHGHRRNGGDPIVAPPMDKANYISRYSPEERCLEGVIPMGTAIDESSGSTGTPYNWVRSTEERHVSHIAVSHFARYSFGHGDWITINAFSMGAWATGINMGIALQRNSIVKNTGPDIDKVFSTMEFFGPEYRYLICGYPPFLKRIIDMAKERDFPLERYRLMALLGGEGNSEGLRDYLSSHFDPVYSGYGATDVEIGIAGETPLSLAIRRRARSDGRLRQGVFGGDSRLPMVFQYNPLMHHIVTNGDGELIFTISRLHLLSPRIMYNIHDEGGVAGYPEMEARFREAGLDLNELGRETGRPPLKLPFLWIYGRRDSTISVMGANIYPEDVEQCLYSDPELAQATHSYCLSLEEGLEGAVRPCFSFEIQGEITDELQARFEAHMTPQLRDLNADFREAMAEYQDTVTPVIQLFPMGAGPFSGDGSRIKQTRMMSRGQ